MDLNRILIYLALTYYKEDAAHNYMGRGIKNGWPSYEN